MKLANISIYKKKCPQHKRRRDFCSPKAHLICSLQVVKHLGVRYLPFVDHIKMNMILTERSGHFKQKIHFEEQNDSDLSGRKKGPANLKMKQPRTTMLTFSAVVSFLHFSARSLFQICSKTHARNISLSKTRHI